MSRKRLFHIGLVGRRVLVDVQCLTQSVLGRFLFSPFLLGRTGLVATGCFFLSFGWGGMVGLWGLLCHSLLYFCCACIVHNCTVFFSFFSYV